MSVFEVNVDGLPGLTHNYAGLSFGNVASNQHAHQPSSPKTAALQSLDKMWQLSQLGVKQLVMPPQVRPDKYFLQQLGFTGSLAEMLNQVKKQAPYLLAIGYSAASMWAANAATVAPSQDTTDGRVHFTPANLVANAHRALEPTQTAHLLKLIFHSEAHFKHHCALPAQHFLGDEGAANHTRLCHSHADLGLHLFVYGREGISQPTRVYPARQSLVASQAVARHHQLASDACLFSQQNPHAIDAGAFHNDVVAVGNENVFLFHERAFADKDNTLSRCHRFLDGDFYPIEIKESQLSLQDAVTTYLFNSQILTVGDTMVLVAPKEVEQTASARQVVEWILSEANPISKVVYVDCRQSMQNGGGPACLRLRVVLNEREWAAVNPHFILTEERYESLKAWVKQHYRDSITVDDLVDPKFADEVIVAYEALSKILACPGLLTCLQLAGLR